MGLEKLGLKVKLATAVAYKRDVVFKYELKGGHDNCLAAAYDAFPEYLWAVDPD